MIFAKLVITLLLVGPAQELLSDPDAQRLFEEAQVAFEEGEFEIAAKKIERAYLIEPEDALLYPWAQAERSLGRCEIAIDLYRQFLATGPSEQFAAATQQNIDRCEEELAQAEDVAAESSDEVDDADPEPLPAASPTEPSVADEPARSDHPVRPWYTDVTGGVLSGVGLAGIAIGGGLLGAAAADANSAGDQVTHSAYEARRDRATARRNGGLAAVSIGSALLLGGVTRYILVGRKQKTTRSAALWSPDGRGLGMTVVGRF
jgi:tetratricopeptide (TPR) repeat protein